MDFSPTLGMFRFLKFSDSCPDRSIIVLFWSLLSLVHGIFSRNSKKRLELLED